MERTVVPPRVGSYGDTETAHESGPEGCAPRRVSSPKKGPTLGSHRGPGWVECAWGERGRDWIQGQASGCVGGVGRCPS